MKQETNPPKPLTEDSWNHWWLDDVEQRLIYADTLIYIPLGTIRTADDIVASCMNLPIALKTANTIDDLCHAFTDIFGWPVCREWPAAFIEKRLEPLVSRRFVDSDVSTDLPDDEEPGPLPVLAPSAQTLQMFFLRVSDCDGAFIGAVIVEARSLLSARLVAEEHGITLGEKNIFRWLDMPVCLIPPIQALNRPLTRAEVEEFVGPGMCDWQ